MATNPEKEYFSKIHNILSDTSGNYLADTNYIIAYELHSLTQAVQDLQKDIDEQTEKLYEQLRWLRG